MIIKAALETLLERLLYDDRWNVRLLMEVSF